MRRLFLLLSHATHLPPQQVVRSSHLPRQRPTVFYSKGPLVHTLLHSAMARILALLGLVLVALFCVAGAQSFGPVECQRVRATAEDGDSHIFNFTSLQQATTTPLKMAHRSGNSAYEFSIFNNFPCAGRAAGACQEVSNGGLFPLGAFSSGTTAVWNKSSEEYPNGAVTFQMGATVFGGVQRNSHLTVICDPEAEYVLDLLHILPNRASCHNR